MQYTYDVTLTTHIFLVWVLILSNIYLFYIVSIKQIKTIKKIQKIRLFLPFFYTMLSILFFTGLILGFLNTSLGVFNLNMPFAYMIFAILFSLIGKIKIFKATKPINSTDYKQQVDFLYFVRKMIMLDLAFLIIGSLLAV